MTSSVRLAAGVTLAFMLTATSAFAAPRVVASIKPIHSIAASLMQGTGEPELLLDAAVSEHTAQLKPSQVEALQNADLILVVGDNLEAFFRKALENPEIAGKRTLKLAEAPGVRTLPVREGGVWEAHQHGEGDGDHDHDHDHDEDHATGSEPAGHEHEHEHEGPDPHVWMDPENAKAIAAAIAAELSRQDPANAAVYAANRKAFDERMDKLSKAIETEVAPVRDRRFIVFHDAYQYFENRFGLAAAGSITLNPESTPGAKRLSEIHRRIADTGSVCVFAEPQFEAKYVQTVVEGTAARTAVLDGLGAGIAAGPAAYEEMMKAFTADLTQCLRG
ncbi:MAG: zinc ABC transporter substrate-binding protein ZnuA [Rhizobiales bacterium]|nr:zinc ABC transporter substrate-binding protein ZnuA [Hyphomicrobiales bacterium]